MEMTKQRKMLIGVLCLGLGGLAVDRFIIGSPDTASADAIDVVAAAVPDTKPEAAPMIEPETNGEPVKTLPSYASLTERLAKAQQQHTLDAEAEVRDDPFAMPVQWQAAVPVSEPEASTESVRNANWFTEKYKLDGTVRTTIDNKDEMMAVISGGKQEGLAIRVNQKIRLRRDNGDEEVYTLIKVGPRFAVWRLDGTESEFTMRVAEVLSGQ